MLIDCDTCSVRGQACGECVVNLLFGDGPAVVDGDPDGGTDDRAERYALQALADVGFEVTVLSREEPRPRLRLVAGPRHDHHAA
ncbi:MAG: hypothetical protein QOI74_2333 [Micromonosporaceae bacterium]|jgi:hypothetical protein|nr:hypothetical protein [Micromonosporaceae bacterium]MDT5037570.1 hypothetical protein [Micromonosporaceae bacterium]